MYFIYNYVNMHIFRKLTYNLDKRIKLFKLFSDKSKVKTHLYYFLISLRMMIETYLVYSHSSKYIIENENVDKSVQNHYSSEIGLYIYDFMSMDNKLGVYGFHHIMSTFLLISVIRNNLYNYGIYLLMIMNTSTPFLYLAKLTRNFKNKKLFIYTDSIFLMLFGYCRVYLLSDNLYLNLKAINTYNIYLRSLLGTMWGLQVLWFVKLNRMFFDQHMRRNLITNHSH
jgi:hypothetical protein